VTVSDVTLAWGAVPDAESYDVHFTGTGIDDLRPGVTSPQVLTGLTANTAVNWTVTAKAAQYTPGIASGTSTTSAAT
jgi:hypothetical protein